jgi:protein O-mannosyl-transferase
MESMAKRTRKNRPMPATARAADIQTAPQDSVGSARWLRHAPWLLALLLIVTFVAYLPAMRGGFIWDDDGHVTRPELRSFYGLYRIWFEVGATQQYYPLLHSAFWLEQRLWGDDPLAYHLANLLFHCGVVCLVYAVLQRLKIPGALLAAAIFAVHPVNVESVAWITEQKNTLSALFYLGAMLAYLQFYESRGAKCYWFAFTLFVLGLLAKTVTATLPAALLVIFWWQRGKLSWRSDVRPLLPFFGVGAAAGVLTAWVERKLIGAQGADFELSFLERGLIAGHAIWFYLGKLIWPVNLTFIYPRWSVDTAVWWQWLFPLSALAVMAALALVARRFRAPLAGWLFFVGTLFPVLGFLNVYPFVYSFVADHFQYLASLGMIALFAVGMALAVERLPVRLRWVGKLASVLLVAVLSILSWRQSEMYSDLDTLYQTTIDRNPSCWMAYNNLGVHVAKDRQDDATAMALYRRALELKSDYADAHYNLANALVRSGNRQEALEQFNRSLELRPGFPDAENNLANLLKVMGQPEQAVVHLKRAVRMEPDDAEIQNNLGTALLAAGDADRAIEPYEQAIRLQPDGAIYHCNLAKALLNSQRPAPESPIARAIEECRIAIQLDPDLAESHHNLGVALARSGKFSEAAHEFQETIRLEPTHAEAYGNLAKAFAVLHQPKDAIATAEAALELARSSGDQGAAGQIEAWLANYREQQAKSAPPVARGK